jgi:putative oxidoreductase
MVRFLFPGFPAGRLGFGLLALRLVVGAAFLFHGWPKIQNPLGWMDRPEAPSGMPGVLQAAAALSEFGGGAALTLGLLTPLAALGLAATMVTAIGMVHLPKGDPFVPPPGWQGGSWELAAVYLAAVTLLLMAGPGRFSLDALLFGRPPGTSLGWPEQERAAPAG